MEITRERVRAHSSATWLLRSTNRGGGKVLPLPPWLCAGLSCFYPGWYSLNCGNRRTRTRAWHDCHSKVYLKRVSGRRESHPPALAELSVSLSTHSAPIVQPSGRAS